MVLGLHVCPTVASGGGEANGPGARALEDMARSFPGRRLFQRRDRSVERHGVAPQRICLD